MQVEMQTGGSDQATSDTKNPTPPSGRLGWRRGVAIIDFLVRMVAIGATLAAAIAMATTDETLPFFTQFFQFEAKYNDFPTFTFFVIANAIAGGYLVLSLPISIFNIVRPRVAGSRLFLILFDTVMVALDTAGASAAAAIVYLAHKGNSRTNWFSICQQFNSFCERVSGALIASFAAAIFLILLVVLSASNLYKRPARNPSK